MTATRKVFSDGTGIAVLGSSVMLATVNSMLFTVSAGLPISPITRGGLLGNIIAVSSAWLILWKGDRQGLIQQLVTGALVAWIHFFLVINIWSVVAYKL